METIKEFFQNIYDSSTERIKSPLVGSFIISFIIFNWRAFAILFYSEWPVHCRIEWIEANYCNWSNLLIPIGIALIYIVPLPYINLIIDFLLGKYSKKRAEEKKAKRTDDLHQQKDFAELERQVADAKAGTSQIITLQSKIENLQQEINDLIEQNKLDHNRWVERADTSLEKEKELIKINQQKDKEIIELRSSITETIHKYENLGDFDNLMDPDLTYRIKEVAKNLSKKEQSQFIQLFSNGRDRISFEILQNYNDFFKKLSALELVSILNNWGHLTVLGRYVLIHFNNESEKHT